MNWTTDPPTVPGLYVTRKFWKGDDLGMIAFWAPMELRRVPPAPQTEAGELWWLGPLPETPEDGSAPPGAAEAGQGSLLHALAEVMRLRAELQLASNFSDGTHRLHCTECGKSVSSPVHSETVVRAVLTCPECIPKIWPEDA